MLSARAGRDNDPNITDYSYNLDRAGSYCIMYDSVLQTVQAMKWGYGHTFTSITDRDPSNYTEYAVINSVSEGWHTFRIECFQDIIRFYLDGNLIADVIDTEYISGRPGIGYRETGVDSAEERQGHFDNLQAGPHSIEFLATRDWELYE
jgi:hypothetical protein